MPPPPALQSHPLAPARQLHETRLLLSQLQLEWNKPEAQARQQRQERQERKRKIEAREAAAAPCEPLPEIEELGTGTGGGALCFRRSSSFPLVVAPTPLPLGLPRSVSAPERPCTPPPTPLDAKRLLTSPCAPGREPSVGYSESMDVEWSEEDERAMEVVAARNGAARWS